MRLPVLESGFWFHQDVRDNLYYAMHLMAAMQEEGLSLELDREEAGELAMVMMLKVLGLQDRDPNSGTYGHWPLQLGNEPERAKLSLLPVELMGVLLDFFDAKYGRLMTDD